MYSQFSALEVSSTTKKRILPWRSYMIGPFVSFVCPGRVSPVSSIGAYRVPTGSVPTHCDGFGTQARCWAPCLGHGARGTLLPRVSWHCPPALVHRPALSGGPAVDRRSPLTRCPRPNRSYCESVSVLWRYSRPSHPQEPSIDDDSPAATARRALARTLRRPCRPVRESFPEGRRRHVEASRIRDGSRVAGRGCLG